MSSKIQKFNLKYGYAQYHGLRYSPRKYAEIERKDVRDGRVEPASLATDGQPNT